LLKSNTVCAKNFFIYFHIVSLTIITIFFPHSQSFAEPAFLIDSDKQFDFAEYYFSTGEYFRAIDEYKRFIYLFPQDERVKPAMYNVGLSFYKSRRLREAINSFKTLIDKYCNADLFILDFTTKAYFMVSECYLKLNEPGPAVINLNNLIKLTADLNIQDEAYYRLGWIFLETASWDNARLYFGKISIQNKNKYELQRLSAELDKERLITRKNPALAGTLSIIPGAGYLYCGRYKDAIIAFLLNGGLMYAAYESFDNDLIALGGIITFFELGFYSGNIYGAIAGAHKYNKMKNKQFLDKLKENTKIDLSYGHKNKDILLSFQFSF